MNETLKERYLLKLELKKNTFEALKIYYDRILTNKELVVKESSKFHDKQLLEFYTLKAAQLHDQLQEAERDINSYTFEQFKLEYNSGLN
jgi:hypothetical protein